MEAVPSLMIISLVGTAIVKSVYTTCTFVTFLDTRALTLYLYCMDTEIVVFFMEILFYLYFIWWRIKSIYFGVVFATISKLPQADSLRYVYICSCNKLHYVLML